jgi:plasmid stabilization system protein ParE
VRGLIYLVAARRDLVEIFDFITRESGSLAIGRRFTDALRYQWSKLAALPGTLGRARPALRPDVRSFAHRGYVIFFRYQEGAFEVVRSLEGHRDSSAHVENN